MHTAQSWGHLRATWGGYMRRVCSHVCSSMWQQTGGHMGEAQEGRRAWGQAQEDVGRAHGDVRAGTWGHGRHVGAWGVA